MTPPVVNDPLADLRAEIVALMCERHLISLHFAVECVSLMDVKELYRRKRMYEGTQPSAEAGQLTRATIS